MDEQTEQTTTTTPAVRRTSSPVINETAAAAATVTTPTGSIHSNGTPNVKRTSSTSSNYDNINANLHARVKAFQEQRALKRSASIGSNKSDHNESAQTADQQQQQQQQQQQGTKNIQHIVNKPLPPLPPMNMLNTSPKAATAEVKSSHRISMTIETTSTIEKNVEQQQQQQQREIKQIDERNIRIRQQRQQHNIEYPLPPPTNMAQFNPSRRAPRLPVNVHAVSGSAPPPITSSTLPNRPVKQSLSARRGLKLPPGGMSLKMLNKPSLSLSSSSSSLSQTSEEFSASPSNKTHKGGKHSNPGSLINGVQSTATSSSNNEQHDTKGTTPPQQNNCNNSSLGSGSGGSGGLFANFAKYVDIKSGSLNFAGKLSLSSKGIDFSNGSSSRITLAELEFIEELGHGNYGNVSKVLHKPTNVIMAMKEVKLELDEAKFRQILMELEVLHKCKSPYIVDFYGAFFIEGAVYMCMEYMDGGSLDKIYDQDPEIGGIDEPQLAVIATAVIRGLKVLKDVHHIIHRDVKPTNILCSAKQGTIKLCDFGVSGNLVASMAKTNIGCQSYMAPERIKSLNPDIATYTVQSDIWSLGLSILEMALGRYPYPPETFDNIFSQLSAIVDGPPPKLPAGKFSKEAQDFVSLCLQKVPERRLNYTALLEHPWLVKYRDVDVGMSEYLTTRKELKKRILAEKGNDNLPKKVPALHMGGL